MGSSRSHRDANSCGTFGSTPRFRRPFRIFPSEKKETLGRGTWQQQLRRRCPPRVSKRDYAQSASRHSLPRRLPAPGPATSIAKWSHLGPLAMSELELGSLVVQRCLCCLLGMCVFLVVRTLFATVGRLGARSVTCSSGLLAGGLLVSFL